jgi:peptidoglycan-associated lipoprotein
MLMKRNIFLYLFAILLTSSVFAQPVKTVTYATKLATADECARNGDYYNAIDWFNQAYDESKDMTLQVAIADLYVRARDYKRAELGYSRILKRDRQKEFEDIRASYGDVLKAQGKYAEALEQYTLVLANAEIDDSIKKAVTVSKSGIDAYESYPQNLEVGVGFIKGKVNSGSAESAPILGPDGKLYFSSFNSRREIILDGKEGDYHAKVFSATQNDKGDFDKTEKMNDLINRPGFHHGGVAFSRDGRKMYFTRAKLLSNGLDQSEIFYVTSRGASWGAPTTVDALNGDFINKHPFEGDLFGRQVIFFSSNREGGFGGFDLYYSEITGDTYSTPVNLGPTVNTAGDEVSPFYKDGALYYSTDGRPGMGGFDIFFAQWTGSNWTDPANMGFQYNTSFDDMFLRFNPDGRTGFLVSNRPEAGKPKMKGSETCCDDIYMIGIRDMIVSFQASVVDPSGRLDNATIEVYDLTQGGYPDTKTNPASNEFSFPLDVDRRYKVVVTKEGFYPDSIQFNTNGIISDSTISKNFVLKPKPVEEDVQVVRVNEAIRLNNIYYDLDKADILPESEPDLSYLADLMIQYPKMVIELSSHTDAQGSDSYNEKLSQRRSDSAKQWLERQGIEQERIKAVGYGERVILNRCANGVRCSDEEHMFNRRTEFKILSGVTSIEMKKDGYDGKATPTQPTLQNTRNINPTQPQPERRRVKQ